MPAAEVLRESGAGKLMPPLVVGLRKAVKECRLGRCVGAPTTIAV